MAYVNAYLDAWKKYFTCRGRSNRMQFWVFELVNWLISAILLVPIANSFLNATFQFKTYNGGFLGFYLTIFVLWEAITFCPTIMLTIRRFHDVGFSGMVLVVLIILQSIPLVGFVCAFIQFIILLLPTGAGVKVAKNWGVFKYPSEFD